jgi:hypothetical protein
MRLALAERFHQSDRRLVTRPEHTLPIARFQQSIASAGEFVHMHADCRNPLVFAFHQAAGASRWDTFSR